MFNMLAEKEDGEDTDTADDATTVMQTAAFMTESTLSNTYGGATAVPLETTTAINQLAANQVAIQQQMAAMTFAAPPPSLTRSFTFPLSRTWGSNLLRERPRACSTLGKAAEAISVEDTEEDTLAVVGEGADAGHLQTKCLG
jgi:hypothetical protein